MKKKVELNLLDKRVALFISLPFLIFSFLALAIVFANDLPATVTVAPSLIVECKPDIINIGSNLPWINCFIEISNADVSKVDISTVKLAVQGVSGSVNADPTFSHLDDFDSDGRTDLQVRFSKPLADQTIFKGISSTTQLTLSIDGKVSAIGFSGTDSLLLVKSSKLEVARYLQVTSQNVGKANIKTIEGVDLSKYIPTKTVFDGYFVSSGDPKIFGNNGLYSEGYILTPRTVYFFRIPFTIYTQEKITIGAFFEKYDDCFANKTTYEIHCEGSGLLLVRNQLKETTFRDDIPTMRVDIKDYKVTLEGGNIWNDIISVSNIKINKIMIR